MWMESDAFSFANCRKGNREVVHSRPSSVTTQLTSSGLSAGEALNVNERLSAELLGLPTSRRQTKSALSCTEALRSTGKTNDRWRGSSRSEKNSSDPNGN